MEDDVNWSPTEVEIILMACNRVTTAFLAIPSCPLSAVATFYHLRRLAIPFMELEDLSESDRATVLHNLTHLALLNSDRASSCRNPGAFLAMLPHLTYISFDWIGLIIKMCLALPLEMMQNRFQSLIHDSHFVCIDQQGNRREAWLRGIDGGRAGRVNYILFSHFLLGKRVLTSTNSLVHPIVFGTPMTSHLAPSTQLLARSHLFMVNTVDGSATEVTRITVFLNPERPDTVEDSPIIIRRSSLDSGHRDLVIVFPPFSGEWTLSQRA
ncbi:hypothetical protein DFH08DRAFT_799626 [Mycena albidolilacea]|uniref:Uncharacterized protein n=1 Tax=Mycena albidolilacea TaxID=1033008 RepID=A0AAD7ALZ4_9AGAR|nr:hypothetical protein DFH08DRAFT_799626 [Mycena albidolilacea]